MNPNIGKVTDDGSSDSVKSYAGICGRCGQCQRINIVWCLLPP